MADFKAQLGRADHPGLASQAERLARIVPGQNPYVTGHSLPPDSPVFFGRERELAETLGVLRRPDKPGSVSVLGERRFGKSSFLNQVWQALAAEPDLVCIHATTQDWGQACPERFFGGLHLAILGALDATAHAPSPKPAAKGKTQGEVRDYAGMRDFIRPLARAGLRFVLLLDELERITGAEPFNADFFSNLRALGERPEYRFGYLISSRRPLKELCREHRIDESSFWNIFGFPQYIGLLDEDQARALALGPLGLSLPGPLPPDLDGQWTEGVVPLTGGHPALIQLVLADLWSAWAGGYDPNWDRIAQGLRDYLEDLWTQRHGKEEWRVLMQAATGAELAQDPVVRDLRLRGLVTDAGRPLCAAFAELIPGLMPAGLTMEKALAGIKQGGDAAGAVFKTLEEWAGRVGRVHRALKGLGGDLGETGGDHQ